MLDAPPRLRPGLLLVPRGASGALLCDETAATLVELSPAAARLVELLDGERSLAEAAASAEVALDEAATTVDALAAHLMLTDAELDRRRNLMLLHRIERARIARGQLRIGPTETLDQASPLHVQVRSGLRWSCIGCGACCSGRFAVQLNPRDEATLRALDLEPRLGLALDDVLVYGEPGPLPGERPWLRTRDGHCVFLGSDGRCNLHRHFGAEAKPEACRAFPFEPIRTPDGPLLRYRPECSGQVRTATTGASLDAARAAGLWRDLAQLAEGVLEVPPGPFVLCADVRVSWEEVRRLTTEVEHAVDACGVEADFAPLRAAAREALGERDDEQPGPLEHVLLLDLMRRRAFAQLVSVQATPPMRGLLGPDALDRDEAAALVHGTFELLREAVAGLPDWPERRTAGTVLIDPLRAPSPLPPAAAPPASAPCAAALTRLRTAADTRAVLARYALDALCGQYLLHAETLLAGVGLVTVVTACALASAAWAHVARGRPLDAATLNEALVLWHLQVFGHAALRVDLQLELRDPLERISLATLLALPEARRRE